MFLGNEFHLHGCLVQSSPVQIEAFEGIENAFGRATLFFLLLSTSIVMPIGEFVIVRLIVVVIVGCCDGNRWLWSDGDGFLTHVPSCCCCSSGSREYRSCWLALAANSFPSRFDADASSSTVHREEAIHSSYCSTPRSQVFAVSTAADRARLWAASRRDARWPCAPSSVVCAVRSLTNGCSCVNVESPVRRDL